MILKVIFTNTTKMNFHRLKQSLITSEGKEVETSDAQ